MTDSGLDNWLPPGPMEAHMHLRCDGGRDAVAQVANSDREIVLEAGSASEGDDLSAPVP